MKTRITLSLITLAALAACAHPIGGRATHIDTADTPPAVTAGFNREFPGLTISHTDRIQMPDNSTQYELKFRDAANHYHRKLFTSDGRLLSDKSGVILPTTPGMSPSTPTTAPGM